MSPIEVHKRELLFHHIFIVFTVASLCFESTHSPPTASMPHTHTRTNTKIERRKNHTQDWRKYLCSSHIFVYVLGHSAYARALLYLLILQYHLACCTYPYPIDGSMPIACTAYAKVCVWNPMCESHFSFVAIHLRWGGGRGSERRKRTRNSNNEQFIPIA